MSFFVYARSKEIFIIFLAIIKKHPQVNMPKHNMKKKTSRTKKQQASPTRTFVIVTSTGKEKGRYVSKTPAGAAKKVGGRILKQRGHKSVTVRVRETTAGSKKKLYTYAVMQVKLNQKKVVLRDGKRIVYEYKTVIKAKK
jgi:hypothetical protein